MSKAWTLVKLGEVISQRKEFITIDDTQEYMRCRVQLHAKGIVLRDRVTGSEIKTKQQQVCRAGEFLVAEIDAKVGGFGIVPDELEDSIVSSHYFLFTIDSAKLNKKFLDFYSKTPTFREQVNAKGSTNYAAIRPQEVLNYTIPLPPLAEQQQIVAKIERLAGKIQEAKELREQIAENSEAFTISVHINFSGTQKKKIGDILTLDEDRVLITKTGEYPQVGVKSFGGGLFPKASVYGTETAYKNFNRLYEGTILLSQVKGWEGAIAVCDKNLAGWYVSPEYHTFRCIPNEAIPGYMAALVRTEWFWKHLKNATRGVGARRERTRPEQFLTIQIPMPDIKSQKLGQQLFTRIEKTKHSQAQIATSLDAMLPSILDKAFKGEL